MNAFFALAGDDELNLARPALLAFKLALALLMLLRVSLNTILAVALIGGLAGLVVAAIVRIRPKQASQADAAATDAQFEAAHTRTQSHATLPPHQTKARPLLGGARDMAYTGGALDWWFCHRPCDEGIAYFVRPSRRRSRDHLTQRSLVSDPTKRRH